MQRMITLVVCLACALAAQTTKQYKSQEEYELYNAATKAIAANDSSKAVASLDAWAQKYPDSDYKDDRQFLYVLVYAGAKQPAKAIDAAGPLLAKPDLETALPGAADQLRLLYTTALAIQDARVPTAEEIAIAADAARRLLAFNRKPEGLTDEAWTQARNEVRAAAKRTLLFVTLLPGTRAMAKGDCAAAEAAYLKAIEEYPESVEAQWGLGSADLCLYKTQPSKAIPAIYAFARAAALNPEKGMVDPKWQQTTVEPFLEKVFQQYHGADRTALEALKRTAAESPLPPPGFIIPSAAEIAREKQVEFDKNNPQLALWSNIKAALIAPSGETYFASELKGAAVPQLRGVLLEAKPACRPTELRIAVPLPDSPEPHEAEIVLKLDMPLAGRPELQAEVQWEGVPTAFTQTPFLLTMDVERSKIEGLKLAPCARKR
ncbi:MAG: hypothetical protein JO336_00995 [Acidobacteriia bacterium]|nr:hypothetical protein [Terriglobia bacterium]